MLPRDGGVREGEGDNLSYLWDILSLEVFLPPQRLENFYSVAQRIEQVEKVENPPTENSEMNQKPISKVMEI
jgi:hypothetical protein